MRQSLITGSLIACLALASPGCVVLDAASAGISILAGNRLLDVSGLAKTAKEGDPVEAINLRSGALLARATVGADKRFRLQIALPMAEEPAIVLRAPNHAALLMGGLAGKRQEARDMALTRGSTTVAWALGAAVAGIPLPSKGNWDVTAEQWARLAERVPASQGEALQAAAATIETAGVADPASAAAELASSLSAVMARVRDASGGHPREAILWPPTVLGWVDALTLNTQQAPGDRLGSLAASAVDIATAAERAWSQSPYEAEQGALEVHVPLLGAETRQRTALLPDSVKALRYRIEGALLAMPRDGDIPREWLRYENGALTLRIPDLPLGYVKVTLRILGENGVPLASVTQEGQVAIALIRKLTTDTVEVPLAETPSLTPGARE